MGAPTVKENATELSTIASLKVEVAELKESLYNFLAKFGTYYNSDGVGSMFIVDRLLKGGAADGMAITSSQGVIETFGLPMKLARSTASPTERGSYWVPQHIPEPIDERAELAPDGDNPQKDA